jgi:hypothetical protein
MKQPVLQQVAEKGSDQPFMSFPRKRESSISGIFWTPAAFYPRKGGGGSNRMARFFGKLLNVLEPRKTGCGGCNLLSPIISIKRNTAL